MMHELAPFKYQEYGSDQLKKKLHTGLISPPGSGKTRTLIMGMLKAGVLIEDEMPYGAVLIVCSGPARATWMKQLQQWIPWVGPEDIHIVRGDKVRRLKTWNKVGYGFYICTYEAMRIDEAAIKKAEFGCILADEYHKRIRGHKTVTYKAFRRLTKDTHMSVMASGTSYRKNPSTLYSLMNHANRRIFSSYYKWINISCLTVDNGFGQEIIGPKNVENLKKILDQFIVFIPEEVVADQLPEGMRSPLPITMDDEQAEIYSDLQERLISFTASGEVVIAQTSMTLVLRLRQLLCCPKILDESLGMGAGFEAIYDTLDEESHITIFVPFRDACDYIKEELNKRGHEDVFILRGGIEPEEQTQIVEQFGKTRGIMICTISYAESFDLVTCGYSYFLGYEYVLDLNEQAEGRTRRAISENRTCYWRYIKYEGTVDDFFLHNLNMEVSGKRRLMSRPEEFIEYLKTGQ